MAATVVLRAVADRTYLYEVAWQTESGNGMRERLWSRLTGTIESATIVHSDSAVSSPSTYDIRLLDKNSGDLLQGLGLGAAINTTTDVSVYSDLGSSRWMPVYADCFPVLEVSFGTTNTTGRLVIVVTA